MPSLKALKEIPSLTHLYRTKTLIPSSKPDLPKGNQSLNDKICTIQYDITKLQVDAIVNAANRRLRGGGGVDGAIHRAAGIELLEECVKLGGCETGSAKITNAYNLPCKKVIHAVGPVFSSIDESEPELRGCYRAALQLAVENDCKSIAFSAISTGIYGYPSQLAAKAAVREVVSFLRQPAGQKLDKVIFCSFMEKDVDAYAATLPEICPPTDEDLQQEGFVAPGWYINVNPRDNEKTRSVVGLAQEVDETGEGIQQTPLAETENRMNTKKDLDNCIGKQYGPRIRQKDPEFCAHSKKNVETRDEKLPFNRSKTSHPELEIIAHGTFYSKTLSPDMQPMDCLSNTPSVSPKTPFVPLSLPAEVCSRVDMFLAKYHDLDLLQPAKSHGLKKDDHRPEQNDQASRHTADIEFLLPQDTKHLHDGQIQTHTCTPKLKETCPHTFQMAKGSTNFGLWPSGRYQCTSCFLVPVQKHRKTSTSSPSFLSLARCSRHRVWPGTILWNHIPAVVA